MKKRIRTLLSVLFLAAILVNVIPVYAGATATVAPTAAATDAAATDAAATDAAGGAVTYSGNYNAYMGFQTDTNLWIFRNKYDDATYGFGTEEFKGLSSVKDGVSTRIEGTFTDALIDGDGTYTVTLENPDLQNETHISLLYVTTDIPISDSIKIANVTCKFDGSTKQTLDVGTQDKDSKQYVCFLLLNNWNPDFKDTFFYPMPFKKCEITFTISGLGYPSAAQAAAAAATPTVAPAADASTSTDAAATDTAATDDSTAASTDSADSSTGLSTGAIIGIVAAAVVVVVVVVVAVLAKKKKK